MSKKLIKNIIYPIVKSPPDFLIIGTQKGGTTSIARYLEKHPQIIANNSWKEVHYYDLSENYEQGWGWYLGNFPFKWQKKKCLTFDATPGYFYFSSVPSLIKKDFDKIKMIVVLREPSSRAYSAWQMYRSFKDHPSPQLRERADYRTFVQVIKEELNPELSTVSYPYGYVDRGKYAQLLKNYYQYFDPKDILVLQFELLNKNLVDQLQKICEFLEIAPFSSDLLNKLTTKKYHIGKYIKSAEDQVILEELKEFFKPFNQDLYELLKCDYNW